MADARWRPRITGIYSNPVFHALMEFGDFTVIKCNAAHVKNVPGRKTDAADCTWLGELLECGLLRGSYIPAQNIAEVRDLTRYRVKLVGSRTSEIQRISKTLEDAPGSSSTRWHPTPWASPAAR